MARQLRYYVHMRVGLDQHLFTRIRVPDSLPRILIMDTRMLYRPAGMTAHGRNMVNSYAIMLQDIVYEQVIERS